jgi:hypothetical protein
MIAHLSPRKYKEHQALINALVVLKEKFGRIGMYRTMHKMEYAVKECGWELADIMEGKQKS